MPELGPYGSVRGARGNSRPYRERHLLTLSSSQFDPTGTFTIGRYHSRQQKAPEFEMIALSASRLVRLVFVGHDRPKENPTLAVEPHHLELLVDAPIIRRG